MESDKSAPSPAIQNSWQVLRQYTDARIGLGRAGVSLTTHHHLQFQLDHARARDAVLRPIAWPGIVEQLQSFGPDLISLHSRVSDRNQYLQRPDLGRRLNSDSVIQLQNWRQTRDTPVDICVVVADGLSATAIEDQAVPFLKQFLADIAATDYQCDLLCCAEQSRVALGDEVAELVKARFLVMLIGERPGLSAADSMGIYYTYLARVGCSDADRNCLSNVRPKGQSFADASRRLLWLIQESDRRQLSGVKLKDNSSVESALGQQNKGNFLIPNQPNDNDAKLNAR